MVVSSGSAGSGGVYDSSFGRKTERAATESVGNYYISLRSIYHPLHRVENDRGSATFDDRYLAGASIGVGYNFAPWFRAELETSFQSGDYSEYYAGWWGGWWYRGRVEGTLSAFTLGVTGYFTPPFAEGWAVQPYGILGLGLISIVDNWTERYTMWDGGMTWINGTESGSDTDTGVSFSIGFGAEWAVTESWAVDYSYRYLVSSLSGDSDGSYTVYSSMFTLGARYNF